MSISHAPTGGLPTDAAPSSPPPAAKEHNLKAVLIAGDGVAVAIGFVVVLLASHYPDGRRWWFPYTLVACATLVALFCIRSQGLFLARNSAVRIVELTRTTRALALSAGAMVALDRVARLGFRVRYIIAAYVVAWFCFVVWRSGFRAWVRVRRSNGHHQRRVLLVGADQEIARLARLFVTHGELGVSVVGLVGSKIEAERLAVELGVTGAVVSPGALSAPRLNQLIRALQSLDVHLHLATGVSGIDARRLRTVPLSYEPLLYVEAPSLSRLQGVLKRLFDIVVASLVLVLTAPLFALIAVLIRRHDGGPVYFRQERVGRDGATFKVLKFRTMRVDAEQQLAALRAANERNGPLFKMEFDPRVTRVGRFLRESSLDELPQLINVVRGEMSLVGPRPALPSEVAAFAPELRQREQVPPGVTGLWQVEARDNPSFEAYRRLDLFYVENWSLVLDLMIIVGTVEQLAAKVVQLLVRRRRPAPVTTADFGRASGLDLPRRADHGSVAS